MKSILFCLLGCSLSLLAIAQERLAPLQYNPFQKQSNNAGARVALKTTALSLPFFEDFTGDRLDSNLWQDNQVYVNNTMPVDPISHGVATFDALNQYGIPYDPNVNTHLLFADSLTSRAIDLSTYTPGDSIYFSFFYQPQGNGFHPETADSLILYYKKSTSTGAWVRVWSTPGTPLEPFKQVMIPIKTAEFFHADFQFRFVNKASINTNDDVWNVDYIRIGANRHLYDTAVNDIAFTVNPGFVLNDYSYMPYHQFIANPSGELATTHETRFQNNTGATQSLTYGYIATETTTNTPLAAESGHAITVGSNAASNIGFGVYQANIPGTGGYQRVVFENKYFLEGTTAGEPKHNDTIVREQKFENFLAYDDGTAEKSYYLNLFATLPGKTAIEYHLNRPDTLLGVAIYFGRQVPMGYNKDFAVFVYNDIGMNGSSDQVAYKQDFLFPGYLKNDEFYYYKFDDPVPLPQGIFYIGTVQPAAGVSDSLYFGLDANRITGNHLYYNVAGFWESSTVSGALMIRPVMGWLAATKVEKMEATTISWSISPNPANNRLRLDGSFDKTCIFEIVNMQGNQVMTGDVSESEIDISALVPGIYFVRVMAPGFISTPKKLIKF